MEKKNFDGNNSKKKFNNSQFVYVKKGEGEEENKEERDEKVENKEFNGKKKFNKKFQYVPKNENNNENENQEEENYEKKGKKKKNYNDNNYENNGGNFKEKKPKITLETVIPEMPKKKLEKPNDQEFNLKMDEIDKKIDSLYKEKVNKFYLIFIY